MYTITCLGSFQDEEERFETEDEAIDYVLGELPSDDFAYILSDDAGSYTCIVFQGQEWRP